MPVKVSKLPSGKYKVSTPGGTKAKATTAKKALAQSRLLHGVDKGWKPSGEKKSNVSELAVRKFAMKHRAEKKS